MISFFFLFHLYLYIFYISFLVLKISLQCAFSIIMIIMFACKKNSKHNNNNSLFQFFTPKKCLWWAKSNMRIYNFICAPRSYDAFQKWAARSFGLATPGLNKGG